MHCESKDLPSTAESQMEEKTDKHNKRQTVYLYGILDVSNPIRAAKYDACHFRLANH